MKKIERTKVKKVKKTTEESFKLVLNTDDILELVYDYYDIDRDQINYATAQSEIPSDGDYSGMALDITDDNPIVIKIDKKSIIEEDTESLW